MSSNENYQLAVEIVADGAEETAGQVNNVEQEFEEATQTVEEGGSAANDAAAKWAGAMRAIVTGIAVAASGLLTQVPILGSVFEGIKSIVSAVAFQMDKVLRPILQPVADAFFKLSDKIFESEGAIGELIGIAGTLATVFSAVSFAIGAVPGVLAAVAVGALILLEKFGLLEPLFNTVKGAAMSAIEIFRNLFKQFKNGEGAAGQLKSLLVGIADGAKRLVRRFVNGSGAIGRFRDLFVQVGGAIQKVVGQNISPLLQSLRQLGQLAATFLGPVLVATARVAATLASAFISVLVPTVRALVQSLDFLTDLLVGDFSGAWQSLKAAVGASLAAIGALVVGFGAVIKSIFGGLIDIAFQWGKQLLTGFANALGTGISGAIAALSGLAGGVADFFAGLINSAIQWGADLMRNFAQGIMNLATAPVDAAKDALGGIKNAISFDRRENDRQARRWGADMLTEFSVGIREASRSLDMSISADGGGGSDGGTERPPSRQQAPAVYLDGKRVDDRQRRRRGETRRARQRDGA